MTRWNRKPFWVAAALGAGECLLTLFALILLGAFLISREAIPENGMNIVMHISVFISILVSGTTIYGVRKRGILLCSAISAVFLIVCMYMICALAGSKADFSLEMLKNSGVAILASLVCAFVQFRQFRMKGKRR